MTRDIAKNRQLLRIGWVIKLFGHCIATWYAMSQSLVKLTKIMKKGKVNAYIMYIFGKIELLSIHAT